MPTRGRPDPSEVELASRLSALGLSAPAPTRRPTAGPPRGWLPEQSSVVPASSVVPPVPSVPPVPPVPSLLRGWIEDRLPLWAHGVSDRARRRAGLIVATAVVLVIAGVLVVRHHHPGAAAYAGSSWPGSTSISAADTSSTPAPTDGGATPASGSDSIVVDVGGKVRHPGLVTLPPGSRVADAIAAAGGALRRRDIATTDLAARVGDGQLLLIGTAGTNGAAGGGAASGDASSSAGSPPAAPVDLSSADLTTLETLPGIGPVTAQKIIDWRTAHNGFTSVAQLQQVPGIGPAHYAEVESLVTP